MSTNNPAPYPTGQRVLSPREQLQRAQALACVSGKEGAKCQAQIHVMLFFDGTGNNINADYYQAPGGKQKPSNIARLFLTARDKQHEGYFRFYMPGVGTPFPEIGDKGGALGGGAGAGGEARILWALTQLVNAPYRYVTQGGFLIKDTLARVLATGQLGEIMRQATFSTWVDKLQKALKGRKPQVTQINLSVFGFSRGATEARAFVNWLYQLCQKENGGWTFAGIALRTQFLGILDTVASVGLAPLLPNNLPATGHMAWADHNLTIHPAVEQCLHFVAGHEVRACFPSDSVRRGSHYPGNALEVMYPGAHSDVGGGYPSGALGILPEQNGQLCVIPGRRMYDAARQAGVPLQPLNQLTEQIQQLLTPTQQVIADFNAYLRDAKVAPGPTEQMHRRHMALYFSLRFKYRKEFTQRAPYRTASRQHQGYLQITQDSLINGLRKLHAGDPMAPDYQPSRAAAKAAKEDEALQKNLPSMPENGVPIPASIMPETDPKTVAAAMDTRHLTPAIESFLEKYVHDSMAGFIADSVNEAKYNGIGLFKFRTVYTGDQ
ncbi:T6SS phospholipase effector Tle1-like catalytic domain-containing protein [Paludibacterium purpuratum]|uniref:Putative alpha/beta hydrolase family protein DUF2235 n=1 Tax=Paludibacterium purpuratum TaxID=1144873 RepID=A0A4R7B8I3_9NEIS|nr:DUF2235 domain-containing protein [Paludibacterium purpuratum]TDR80105.1 putative alpha/beta hydrolase family protein DUF2235 [Paludibacterium purpuratum]